MLQISGKKEELFGMSKYAKGFVEIKVSELVMCDWNYKYIDTDDAQELALMEALEENFKRNGQVENIIVRELETGYYEVVNGNHRYKVARNLNLKKLMCFNMGKATRAQAIRLAVETNETKFKTDQLKLAERIMEIADEFEIEELSETMPYDDVEFDNFKKLLDFSWDDYESNGSGSSSDNENDDFKTIKYRVPVDVAEQFEAQVNRFKKLLYPEEKEKNVSVIVPLEAMIQTLAQTPDNQILGE